LSEKDGKTLIKMKKIQKAKELPEKEARN